jgi:hypothetical protein
MIAKWKIFLNNESLNPILSIKIIVKTSRVFHRQTFTWKKWSSPSVLKWKEITIAYHFYSLPEKAWQTDFSYHIHLLWPSFAQLWLHNQTSGHSFILQNPHPLFFLSMSSERALVQSIESLEGSKILIWSQSPLFIGDTMTDKKGSVKIYYVLGSRRDVGYIVSPMTSVLSQDSSSYLYVRQGSISESFWINEAMDVTKQTYWWLSIFCHEFSIYMWLLITSHQRNFQLLNDREGGWWLVCFSFPVPMYSSHHFLSINDVA